ncbi:MAG: response regulator, partial [Myxococcota bacterium]
MSNLAVYVADDDPLAAKNIAAALTRETGFDVAAFTTVARLRSAAIDAPPDAVICGLKLGALDGLDVLGEFQESDPDLVAMVLTGATDDDAETRAIAAVGPLRHVRKPCDMADLLPKLRHGLDRRALARELRATRAQLRDRDRELAESTLQFERATAALKSTHSELATATERLVRAEQLAAVGRVVTGIAHELSRQLALVGYAEAIKTR